MGASPFLKWKQSSAFLKLSQFTPGAAWLFCKNIKGSGGGGTSLPEKALRRQRLARWITVLVAVVCLRAITGTHFLSPQLSILNPPPLAQLPDKLNLISKASELLVITPFSGRVIAPVRSLSQIGKKEPWGTRIGYLSSIDIPPTPMVCQ